MPSKHSQRSALSKVSKQSATLTARADSFAQMAVKNHTGLKAPTEKSVWPFADQATKDHYRKYDDIAQSRIALALKQPRVLAAANFHNTGTGAELHVIGRFLQLGYVWEHTIFFQEATLRDFRRSRPFVADIAIRPQGQGLTLMPVDGQEFHAKDYAEIIDQQDRDRALAFLGRVVTIPDTMCWRGRDLDSFLNAHGVD